MTDINSPAPKLFEALQQLKSEGFSSPEIAKVIGVILYCKVSKVLEIIDDPNCSPGMKLIASIIYKSFLDGDIYTLETMLKIISSNANNKT